MKQIGLIFALLGCLSMMNCSKAKDKLMFIHHLKKNITNTYNTEQIEVKINEDDNNIDLLIFITDTKFNNYSTQQKHNMAKTIGQFAIKDEIKTSKIKSGELIFINETNKVLYKTTDSESYKMY
ncbi:conserved hypothetical protein [Formosa agariphila KMM 3901]|uniref:Uncharacterized protein n=1 Tax=Formosa agariphila (strain DSM 15362 / KCTC 12365 / LMG 23005 / KMM 3901 / M-2Alg 35-1) TaxID=1347342 RepID=T2KMS9_FORAG|nr:hypothetical protein [Formosa agariphila]CDF79736.1 conserved hypothetical protein [Formosa agariphila KMM 3901]